MNKRGLISRQAGMLGIGKKRMATIVTSIFADIAFQVIHGEEVSLVGFGRFVRYQAKGRIGVDPRNPSKRITVPPVKIIKFRPGESLKRRIKNTL